MNIKDIMNQLSDTLEFGKTHSFSTINLEVVAINEAQIRINDLLYNNDIDNHMSNALLLPIEIDKTIEQSLEEMVSKDIITKWFRGYANSFVIVPFNEKKATQYIGGITHYSLHVFEQEELA